MNDYGELLSSISKELNILKGENESEPEWMARIVYSAVGQVALASLFDVREDNEPVTITHFKSRVENLFGCYLSMFPELKSVFISTPAEISSEIYDALVQTGCLYHAPNRITSAVYKFGGNDGVLFMRGAPLNKDVYRSGLGAYLPKADNHDRNTIASVYGVVSDSLHVQWKNLTSIIAWTNVTFSSKVEYLRTDPPFSRGYFKDTPDQDGRISILRTGMSGSYIYYFYQNIDGIIRTSQIPAWLVDNYEYRRISNCCLYARGTLPSACYHVDGNIVYLRLRYLLPPAEQNLIQLYSWPKAYVVPFTGFNRIISMPVFFAIKQELEQIGYQFTEE